MELAIAIAVIGTVALIVGLKLTSKSSVRKKGVRH